MGQSRFLLSLLILAGASALQLQPLTRVAAVGSPLRVPAAPRCQFGQKPDTEQRGLSRDSEPDEFFSTNMDDMSDAEKLKSPVVIGGVALIVAPFIIGCIALAAGR